MPTSPFSYPNPETAYPLFLPCAGLTRRLLAALHPSPPSDRTAPSVPAVPVPHGALLAWCVEGDNRGDAHALAELVLRLAEVPDGGAAVQRTEQGGLREPKSWRGLFGATEGWSGGRGDNAELYG